VSNQQTKRLQGFQKKKIQTIKTFNIKGGEKYKTILLGKKLAAASGGIRTGVKNFSFVYEIFTVSKKRKKNAKVEN